MGIDFSDEREGALTPADIEDMYSWGDGYFNQDGEWCNMQGVPRTDSPDFAPGDQTASNEDAGDTRTEPTQPEAADSQDLATDSADSGEDYEDDGYEYPDEDDRDQEEEIYEVEDVANWIGPPGTWT